MQSNRDVKKRGHLNKRNGVGIISVAFLSFFLSFNTLLAVAGPFTIDVTTDLNNSLKKIDMGDGYTVIKIEGYDICGEPGTPALPKRPLHYIINPAEKPVKVRIISCNKEKLPGSYKIFPVQQPLLGMPVESGVKFTEPDTVIYKDYKYPRNPLEISHTGSFDGARIVSLSFCPLIYYPLKGEVEVIKSITFEIETEAGSPPPVPSKRWIIDDIKYERRLRSLVENDNDVDIYKPHVEVVKECNIKDIHNELNGVNPLTDWFTSYLIIAPPSDENVEAFENYVEWERQIGRPTVVKKLSDIIPPNLEPSEAADQLRDYLRNVHYNHGVNYVLLGLGRFTITTENGTYELPFKMGYARPWPPYEADYKYLFDTIPSDIYFYDLDGDWDVDGDIFYGEHPDATHPPSHEGINNPGGDAVDLYPEIMLGRVPIGGDDELFRTRSINNWINKQMWYERVGTLDPTMLTKVYWMQGDYRFDPTGNFGEYPGYFENTLFTQNDDDTDADKAVDKHDEWPGFINWYGHGSVALDYKKAWLNPRYLGTSENYIYAECDQDDAFKSGLNHINYGVYGSYIYSATNCWTSPYDLNNDNIASGYLCRPNNAWKGSVIFMGNARTGWYPDGKTLHKYFLNTLFHKDGTVAFRPLEAGWCEAKSKLDYETSVNSEYSRTVIYPHHLFGSPYTVPWVHIVDELDVSYSFTDYHDNILTVELTVRRFDNGEPVEDAVATVYQPSSGYMASDVTDSNGKAVFHIDLSQVIVGDTAYGTATKYQIETGDWNTLIEQYRPGWVTYPLEPPEPSAGVVDKEDVIPSKLVLHPLSSIVKGKLVMSVGIPLDERIDLSLYNASGRKVLTIMEGKVKAGWHNINMDLKGRLAHGVYFIRLRGSKDEVIEKIIFVK